MRRAAFLAVMFAAGPAFAQTPTVSVSIDQSRVAIGETIELGITVEGMQHATPPTVEVDGFASQYVGPSSYVSIINGQMSSSVTYRYVLVAQREGAFTLGPFTVAAGGTTLQTDPVTVNVVPASSVTRRAPLPAPDQPPAPDVGDALQLQLAVDKTVLYVNETVPARLQLLVSGIQVRGIEMPTLQADGFLIKPLGQPQQSVVSVGGQPSTLLEFDTAVTPIRPGMLQLGPASLKCQVVGRSPSSRRPNSPSGHDLFDDLFDDSFFKNFFGAYQVIPMTVRAAPVTIDVKPLPDAGKPDDFKGAVGRFTLNVTAGPQRVAVGEPVTVTMTVRGQGNLDGLPPPRAAADLSAFKVYEPQARANQGPSSADQKVFEQVLIPLAPSVQEVPQVRFSFFDPALGRYETVTQGPIPLTVTPSTAPVQPTVIAPLAPAPSSGLPREPLGQDIVYIKDAPGTFRPVGWRWHRDAGWLWGAGLAVLLLGISEGVRRHHARLTADPALSRASGALKRALKQLEQSRKLQHAGKVAESYEALFRAVQRYVGDRCNIPSAGVTRDELSRVLGERYAPEQALAALVSVVDRCDAARFAPSSVATEQILPAIRDAAEAFTLLDKWKPA